VPTEVRNLIRHLPPVLKRKVRAALADILDDPTCGKALKEELEGYWSLRVGRTRIVYRLAASNIEIVTIGLRESVYEEATREILRGQWKQWERGGQKSGLSWNNSGGQGVIEIEKPPTGSAISRQVSKGTDVPMRIFLIPF
jgi:mRNA interferase RelE/StbE